MPDLVEATPIQEAELWKGFQPSWLKSNDSTSVSSLTDWTLSHASLHVSYHEQQILFHSHQLHQWKKLSTPTPSPSPSPTRPALSPLTSPTSRPQISENVRRRMAPIMAAWKWNPSTPTTPLGKENSTPHPSPSELEKRLKGGVQGKGVKFAEQAVVIGHGAIPVNDPPPPTPTPTPTPPPLPTPTPPTPTFSPEVKVELTLPSLPSLLTDDEDDTPVHVHAPPPSPNPTPSTLSPFTQFHPSLIHHPYHQTLTAYDRPTAPPPPPTIPPPPKRWIEGPPPPLLSSIQTVTFRMDTAPPPPPSPSTAPVLPPPLPPRKAPAKGPPAAPGAFCYLSPAQLGKHRRQRSKSVDLGSGPPRTG